jgi:cell fate regulator YaaT (PSP1 superfamily)
VRVAIDVIFMIHHVRVGILGHVGRYISSGGLRFQRGARVICRTGRGLEVGEVLTVPPLGSATQPVDGQLLRPLAAEDLLLLERLERHREEAYVACTERLRQLKIDTTLVDVEHLFDGSSLYFYFLGSIPPEVEGLTEELAAIYATKVQFHRFSDVLTEGCGPTCGTEDAAGCGNSCEGCSLARACPTRSPDR